MVSKIRKVPPDWEHPKDSAGQFVSLEDYSYIELVKCYSQSVQDYIARLEADEAEVTLESWLDVEMIEPEYCRPDWPEETRTHFQIYTEMAGIPISPVFKSIPSMLSWLYKVARMQLDAKKEWGLDSEYAESLFAIFSRNHAKGFWPDGKGEREDDDMPKGFWQTPTGTLSTMSYERTVELSRALGDDAVAGVLGIAHTYPINVLTTFQQFREGAHLVVLPILGETKWTYIEEAANIAPMTQFQTREIPFIHAFSTPRLQLYIAYDEQDNRCYWWVGRRKRPL